MSAAVAIGVDVGSTAFKAVVLDAEGTVVGSLVEATNPRIEAQTERVLVDLQSRFAGAASVPVGATGYGRKRVVGAARVLTEITCHARGAFHLARRPGVLVDFGGQDTKVIRFGAGGEVADFAMNDKCAAGTGRFLEVILGRLGVALDDAARLAAAATSKLSISSTCTVFAESEVISLVSQGEPLEAIVLGLHDSLASRVGTMATRMVDGGDVFMSGGVALNSAMAEALSRSLARPVEVLPEPQLVGALGAALAVTPRDSS